MHEDDAQNVMVAQFVCDLKMYARAVAYFMGRAMKLADVARNRIPSGIACH
jgi:hypothetical protein